MPKLTIEGGGVVEVAQGKRLLNALIEDAHVDQLHACGGHARCTTCRVEFVEGEPAAMTEAEKEVLTRRGLIDDPGARLSCQIRCEQDMTVRIVSRLSTSGRADAGPPPEPEITPPPVWTQR